MSSFPYWVWGVLGVLLVLGEALTPVMFLLPMGVAALLVMVLSALGLKGFGPQMWAFAGASIVLTALAQVWLRPMLHKKKDTREGLTGTDRLVGCVGVITDPVTKENNLGRCRVENEDWSCTTLDHGDHLEAGTRVVVKRIEGVKLIVQKE